MRLLCLVTIVALSGTQAAGAAAIETLKVMTLNLGHGRGDALNQVLLSAADIRTNLGAVAAITVQVRPHVLALQEADEDAWWSGRFSQPAYLAQRSGFDYRFAGRHMERFGLHYGTALLSRLPLQDSLSQRFSPSVLTPPKGFVMALVHWPGCPEIEVSVVSVHLDFIRDSVQRRQARELRETVGRHKGPIVLLGDFNTEWGNSDGVLTDLAEELSLHAHEPGKELATFPRFNRRVDWILISDSLRFERYRVMTATVSDHRAVAADITLGPSARQRCTVMGADARIASP